MTNEELAAAIRAGDRSKELDLWEQVRRLAYQRALRVVRALGDDRLVDMDDLMQAAYLAMLDAIEQFDPADGWKFSTIYINRLKTAFAEVTGYRTAAGRKDPLRFADSLDRPVDETDSNSETVGAFVADPLDQMEAVDQRLYRDWQRETISGTLDRLEPRQAQAIRMRYFQNRTLKDIGTAAGITIERVRQLEKAGLRRLRNFREIRQMRQYVESRTDYYKGGRNPVENNVLWRERLEEQFTAHSRDDKDQT
jgi:RNA polymerase sigma factor (sigma-70 family)